MKKLKVVLLFLLILCALSAGIVYFRNSYISEKQEEAINISDEIIKQNDIEKNLNVFSNDGKSDILNSFNNNKNRSSRKYSNSKY